MVRSVVQNLYKIAGSVYFKLPERLAREPGSFTNRELIVTKSLSEVKVLVVDDQPLIVEQLCEFLLSQGHPCVAAHSTDEAIERFSADEAIGLVLCDLHMPNRDGIELMHALKDIAGRQRMFEAIMLTGRADKQDVIRALREGFADYYQKPMDFDELLEGVRRQEQVLLERRSNLQDLGNLNQRLQDLAGSIDELYQDLERLEARASTAAPPMSSKSLKASYRQRSRSCLRGNWRSPGW